MSEEQKKAKKPPRQEWRPNILAELLYRAWRVVFGVAKIALGAAATVAIILVVCLLAFAGALGGYLEDEIIPQAGINLDDFTLDQTSFIYYFDSNGEIKLLQQVHTSTDRQWADFEDIPEDMINAVVAGEDKRFYEHQGVDWFTTVKAFANLFLGDDSVGGSTITQQLVKNLTGDNSVTVQRKLLELFRATDLEKRYDKDIIMEWYLNYIYLGNNCYGVRSAAEKYFGKELEMLTAAECASLISITNNPSVYSPYGSDYTKVDEETGEEYVVNTAVERNGKRKEWILGEMYTQGWLTTEEYEEAISQELVFKDGIADEDRLTTCPNETCGYVHIASSFTQDGEHTYCPVCGTDVVLSEDLSQEVYSWFVDTVLEDLAKDLCTRDGLEWTTGKDGTRTIYMDLIARSGYHIYTTLDMDVQNQVDSIYNDVDNIPDTRSGQQLQSGIVVIDNETGDIVAICGGVGGEKGHDDYNRAVDAKLQTGSSIKPLTVYAPAFEAGAITPATVINDLPYSYDGNTAWPKNDNKKYSYTRSIFSAVEDSVNAVAVNIVDLIGIGYSYEFGKTELGLSSLVDYYVNDNGKEFSDQTLASLGLGMLTKGLTVREMSTAYATLANNGIYREARTYTKVYDSNGNLVVDNEQETRQIFSEKTVNYMNYCLTNAVNQGTGYEAKWDGYRGYVSGKTGTSSDSKDRWFCGFTNYYTAAIWCGYDTPEVIKVTSSGINNPAAYLWKHVMQPLHTGLDKVATYSTSDMVSVSVCLDCGKLATDACSQDVRLDYKHTSGFTRVNTVYVYREDKPTEKCDCHVTVDWCTEGGGVANEWCQHFASEEVDTAKRTTLKERAIVKVTQEILDEIVKADEDKNTTLWQEFLEDDWVYLIKENGKDDDSYKGISGDINQDVDAPYKVCTVHTQEAWEAYLASQVPPETEPTEPEGSEGNDPLGDLFDQLFG